MEHDGPRNRADPLPSGRVESASFTRLEELSAVLPTDPEPCSELGSFTEEERRAIQERLQPFRRAHEGSVSAAPPVA